MSDGAPAYRCQECHEIPSWRLDRTGDAAVSWACSPHLAHVAADMQRDFERTELTLRFVWEVPGSSEGQDSQPSPDHSDPCSVCAGAGCIERCGYQGGCEMTDAGPDSHKVCLACRGTGRTTHSEANEATCPRCKGARFVAVFDGRHDNSGVQCPECHATGRTTPSDTYQFDPAATGADLNERQVTYWPESALLEER